jgi:hypothetical protein
MRLEKRGKTRGREAAALASWQLMCGFNLDELLSPISDPLCLLSLQSGDFSMRYRRKRREELFPAMWQPARRSEQV